MDITGIHLIGVGIIVFVFHLIGKVQMDVIIRDGYCTNGRVTGYENKLKRVGGSWTQMKYPIVEYVDHENNLSSGYIKYAKSTGTYFSVGEDVDIVIHNGKIYYQHAISNSTLKPVAIGLAVFGIAWQLYIFLL